MQQNKNPNVPKNQKSIFSKCVYPTTNYTRSIDSEDTFKNQLLNTLENDNLDVAKESFTQTSKTIIELAKLELGNMSPDSLSPSPRGKDQSWDTPNSKEAKNPNLSDEEPNVPKIIYPQKSLTETFLEKKKKTDTMFIRDITISETSSANSRAYFLQQTSPLRKLMNPGLPPKSRSYVESPVTYHPNFVGEHSERRSVSPPPLPNSRGRTLDNLRITKCESNDDSNPEVKFSPIRNKRLMSFMSPTISSDMKNKGLEINYLARLISPRRRGISLSPRRKREDTRRSPPGHAIENNLKSSEDCLTDTTKEVGSSSATDITLYHAINKLKDKEWNTALLGLAELLEICRSSESQVIFPHMITINQRLIELLRSPRSHVCRTACQAAGYLFEYIKDTRRPEFDDIIDNLLCKTADSNKFIRQDANLALDSMVTHIPIFHSIRALSSKGPFHKNSLVRIATARLMVCAVVLAGVENVMHPGSNDHTRKRIFLNMSKFIQDKNADSRKYGLRVYKLFYKDPMFEGYLKRYLEHEEILRMKKSLKYR